MTPLLVERYALSSFVPFFILAALSQPLVTLVFEHGAFVAADTQRTAAILLFYSPQLPLTAVDYLLINAFYARQNARTPVLVGVVCVVIYIWHNE